MAQEKHLVTVGLGGLTRPPSKADVIAAASVCSTPDGAAYLHQRVKFLYHKAKGVDPDAANELLAILETSAKNLQSIQDAKGAIWEGRSFASDFELLQKQEATNALKSLKDKPINVDCKVAIGPGSEILRSYATDGSRLEGTKANALDKLLNAFLAEHQMINHKDGVIYKEEKGSIKQEGGKPVKASAESVKNIIHDPEKGFAVYVKAHAKSVNIEVAKVDYPAPAAAPIEEKEISSKL